MAEPEEPPPESPASLALSPAAAAFAEVLAREQAGESVDFAVFCAARPELAPELRRIHASWRAMPGALAAATAELGRGTERGIDAATAAESHARLLAELAPAHGDAERYAVDGELARGGMGAILRVRDRRLRRTLAMKVLLDGDLRRADPRALSRFLDEAQITGQLQHPGIVAVHDLGLDAEGRVYFTMPLVRGRSLREVVAAVHARAEGQTLARAAGIVLRVAETIAYAHARGVIHRDLKPANVMVGEFGETYVLDWGVARVLGRPDEGAAANPGAAVASVRREVADRTPDSPLVTLEGQVIGTPAYMAPEQARGAVDAVDARSDVYALGAMLYEVLVGSTPYADAGAAASWRDVLARVRAGPPPRVAEMAPSAPRELVAVCEQAMAREPDSRYPTAMAFADDVRAWLEGRVVRAYESGALADLKKLVKRHKLVAIASGVAALALVAGLLVSTAARRRADAARSDLARELRASDIERGRLLGRLGSVETAETLLWTEHAADPNSLASAWALWEQHRRNPCLSTWAAHGPDPRPDQTPGRRVRAVRWTPDGALLASTGRDAALAVWDADTGARVAHVAGEQVGALDVAPDGALLACSLVDGGVVLRALPSCALVRRIDGHGGGGAARFSPDGRLLAVSSGDGTAHVHDVATGALVESFSRPGRVAWLLGFVATDALAVSYGDGMLAIWERGASAPRAEFEAIAGRPLLALAVAPDGRTLATGGQDHRVRLWEVPSGSPIATLAPSDGDIRGLAFANDGASLFVLGWSRLQEWNVARQSAGRWYGLPSPGSTLDLDAQHDRVATGDERGAICVWDTSSRPGVTVLAGPRARPSPDGALLAVAGDDGMVTVVERATRRTVASFRAHEGTVLGLDWSRDGASIATSGADGLVRVHDLAGGARRCELGGAVATAALDAVACAPDGALAHAVADGTFALHDPATGALQTTLGAPSNRGAVGVRVSPDGRLVAAVARTEGIALWSASGAPLGRLPSDAVPWSVAFRADGAKLAAATWNKTVEIWDVASRARARTLTGHAAVVWSAAFCPDDDRVLASCSADGTVRIWDLTTGRELALLEGIGADHVEFASGSRTLVLSRVNSSALLVDLDYHLRHVAGNWRFQAERLGLESARLDAWAAQHSAATRTGSTR